MIEFRADFDVKDIDKALDDLEQQFKDNADAADEFGGKLDDAEEAGGTFNFTLTDMVAQHKALLVSVGAVTAGVVAGTAAYVKIASAALDYSDALAGVSSNLDISINQADVLADSLVRTSKFQLDNVEAAQQLNQVLPLVAGKMSDTAVATDLARLAIGLASEQGREFREVFRELAEGIGKNSEALDKYNLRAKDGTFSTEKFADQLERVEKAGLTAANPLERMGGAFQQIKQEFIEGFVDAGGLDAFERLADGAEPAAKGVSNLARAMGAASTAGVTLVESLQQSDFFLLRILDETVNVVGAMSGIPQATSYMADLGAQTKRAHEEMAQADAELAKLLDKTPDIRESAVAVSGVVDQTIAWVGAIQQKNAADQKAEQKERNKELAEAAKLYESVTKQIQFEIIALEEGEDAAERFRLKEKGLTDQQIDSIIELRVQKRALADEEEKRHAAQKKADQDAIKNAKELAQAVKEQEDRLANLNNLLGAAGGDGAAAGGGSFFDQATAGLSEKDVQKQVLKNRLSGLSGKDREEAQKQFRRDRASGDIGGDETAKAQQEILSADIDRKASRGQLDKNLASTMKAQLKLAAEEKAEQETLAEEVAELREGFSALTGTNNKNRARRGTLGNS